MEEKNEILEIETYNFEISKNKLKTFSERTQTNIELSKVKNNSGLFGLFDYNVTGKDLNNLTDQIQKYLIEGNEIQIKIIKEFGQIYNTFEALDKDYMNKICLSIKGLEEINKEIKKNINNVDKKVEKNIKNIGQLLDKMILTIKAIIKFKNRVESYEIEKNIKYLEERLNTQNGKTDSEIEALKKEINSYNIESEKSIKYLEERQNTQNSKTDSEIEALKNEINSYNIKSEESIKYLEERQNTQNSKTDSEIEALKNHINSCNIKIEEILETNRSNQIKQNKLEKRILISNVLFGFISITLFLLFFIGRK